MNHDPLTPPETNIDWSKMIKSFLIVFIPVAVLLGGVVTIFYLKETANQRMALKLIERNRLATQKEVICRFIKTIATDVLVVSRHSELRMLLDTGAPRHQKALSREFLWFARIKKVYDQVRCIDAGGMETLRVNFNNGDPYIVPSHALQFKGERYYFKDTLALLENQVFVSPFDLNIEQGKIELPPKPMIRFGTPIFNGDGEKKGVVVLNYLGADMLANLWEEAGNSAATTLLVNTDGYYLRGPAPEDEWGFMYPDKRDRTFAKGFPEAWGKISTAETGQFIDSGGIFTFTTIRPFSEAQISSTGSGKPYAASTKRFKGTDYQWKLISHIAAKAVPMREDSQLARMATLYVVMLALLSCGAFFVAYAGVKRQQWQDALKKHRDHLKQVVERRTAELTQVNAELENDINERKLVEAALRESEAKYRSMMEAMDDAIYICSDDFHIRYMNPAMQELTGAEALGEHCYKMIHGLDTVCPWCVHDRVMQGEHIKSEVVSPRQGKIFHISNSPIFHADGKVSKLTIYRDITDLKKIETQLQQAQKMESVGRLAGGVAHDYNNALSVIMGFTEMALEVAAPDSLTRANLAEVLKAARSAADITRQLLAFARKQQVTPRVLDLNNTVELTLKMLRRLIGENIDLVWLPDTKLWPVKIDPSQINQVLANLCVNARDAIDGVGKVTIETKNTSFDAADCLANLDFSPGEFVLLAVHDNGCGMQKEIMDNIFEPFFTTKGVDKGTGLGLATVYGIVKQNNGFVDVNSAPGKGTRICVYLPREAESVDAIVEADAEEIPMGRWETVLLVEDDPSILKLTREIMAQLGYTVLTAGTPTEALQRVEACEGRIDLLVTDVIMPEMNGADLVARLASRYPQIKAVFMSGYTADVIVNSGVHTEDVHFIQKPFSKKELATTVRKAIDGN
jgi:PAS domain S-box-containing protein